MAFKLIVIGTSLGGFHALKSVLADLPKEFPLPVVVVQHRTFDDSELFAPLLAQHIQLPVVEADDKLFQIRIPTDCGGHGPRAHPVLDNDRPSFQNRDRGGGQCVVTEDAVGSRRRYDLAEVAHEQARRSVRRAHSA